MFSIGKYKSPPFNVVLPQSTFDMKILSRLQLLVCLIFAGLILTLTTQPLLGQTPEDQGWTQPFLIGKGWWQSIAIDRQDQVHIGWYGNDVKTATKANFDVLSYRQRSRDGVWSETNDVLFAGNIGGYTVRNALAATNDGMIHAVFRGTYLHYFSSAPVSSAIDAKSWTKAVPIDLLGYYVNMAAERNDDLHIVYSGSSDVGNYRDGSQANLELNPCALCSDLFTRRSIDGGKSWDTAIPVSLETDSGADRPDIFQGPSGRVYISWDEGYDWYIGRGTPKDVRIVYSDDSGVTWSKPIILDGGALPDRRPVQIALGEMEDGGLMAVWRYSSYLDRNIYYQISKDIGKTWTAPTAIPGIFNRIIDDTPLDDYEIKLDKLGTLHLFVVGLLDPKSSANPALYHIEYRGDNWQTPQRVFGDTLMRPEWPKVVISSQNDIHLSWFIRIRNPDKTESLQVYYSFLKGSLPQQALPTFLPTPTSLPTATVFQNFIPTKTPFPTVVMKAETDGVPNTDIYAIETVLGGVFMVGVFCLGVSLLYRFVTRR